MCENNERVKQNKYLDTLINKPYEYGFYTKIESVYFPKGLSAKIIKLISKIKQEPTYLTNFRLKAYEKWIKNESRNNIIRRDVFEGIEASSEADMIKDFKYPIDFNPEKMLDISIQYYIDIKTKYKIMKQKFIKQTERNYRTKFDTYLT